MRPRFKKWALPYLEEYKDLALKTLKDVNYDFTAIEIGAGKGDFVCGMSKKHPETKFLAVEKVVSVAGVLLQKINENELTNVKLLYEDISKEIIEISDKKVDKIYLNFSDPWPKKRHEKRRLTHPNNLKEYRRILKDDGEIIFKTDNTGLFEYSLETFVNSGFELIYVDNEYKLIDDDVMTEFEKQFREQGIAIHRLIARKKD